MNVTVKYDFAGMVPLRDAKIGDGRLAAPNRFTARFEDDHLDFELDILIDDGAPVCDAVKVTRRDGAPSLSGSELRRIPLAEWVRWACAEAAYVVRAADGRSARLSPVRPSELEEAVAAVPDRRRRSSVTDDLLVEVARLYRAAETDGSPPTRNVREAMSLSERTASRYVRLARERGFLT